jgi:hypothetical protein
MTSLFADRVIQFNNELDFTGYLPRDIRVMNPFKENSEIIPVTNNFYKRFYNDNNIRKLILGINPGRLGAGVTGIPFTDTKRLSEICKIKIDSVISHEPSSVFVYEMIEKYGGVEKFYGHYFIHAICPLGFIIRNEKGNWINCNYYDYEDLFLALKPFIIQSLKKQLSFGIKTNTCYVLGKKNAEYLKRINDEENFFGSIIVLEHPRYIVQYKYRLRETYIDEYLKKLKSI